MITVDSTWIDFDIFKLHSRCLSSKSEFCNKKCSVFGKTCLSSQRAAKDAASNWSELLNVFAILSQKQKHGQISFEQIRATKRATCCKMECGVQAFNGTIQGLTQKNRNLQIPDKAVLNARVDHFLQELLVSFSSELREIAVFDAPLGFWCATHNSACNL